MTMTTNKSRTHQSRLNRHARRHSPRQAPNSRRRSGSTMVYVGGLAVIWLAVTGLVVDMGSLYERKGKARRAADAAALAGALKLTDPTGTSSYQAARDIAALNGYDTNTPGVGMTVEVIRPAGSTSAYRYAVTVGRDEPMFFSKVLNILPGIKFSSKPVFARAVAEFTSEAPMSIVGKGSYGVNGPVNLSVFGPKAWYNFGDPYSPVYAQDGTANKDYEPDGYDFAINIPADYRSRAGTNQVQLEIFDPDGHNEGGTDADGTNRVDELRDGPNGQPVQATTTQYSLYLQRYNPVTRQFEDAQRIQQASYGDTASTDMKWLNFASGDISSLGAGPWRFRLNVKSTDGSSENGFNLRAGPPHDSNNAMNYANGDTPAQRLAKDTNWNTANGNLTEITATGCVPINFNTSGSVTMTLGTVPREAAGSNLSIGKFDTDVGAGNIVYTCSSLPNQTFTGRLSSNGTWAFDSIALPANYTTGVWSATYTAGQQDTSVWKMSYANTAPGDPGGVRLVE